jgi:imidazolonepropionase-like amidohydrolase
VRFFAWRRRAAPPLLVCLLLTALSATPASSQRDAGASLYEGARLIAGDGGPPIEDSAFLVENARFTAVGRRGTVQLPPGARRVDLTGKTVIPGLVDAHSHIGYMKDLTSGAMNYTRENVLDHMKRFAYFGVVASQAMGSDFGELPFELRAEIMAGQHPDAARFLTAGRGLAPLDEIRPDNMRQAANPVTTPDGARALVQELAARNVRIIKTWVDGRGGTVRKLEPAIYTAIIDEAHRRGLRVAVHATDVADAKELLRSGVDVFAHMISEVDDELVALFKAHPNAAVLSALCGPHRAVHAPWLDPVHPLILVTVRPGQITRLQSRFPLRDSGERAKAQAAWDRLAAGIKRLSDAGVPIGAGTDGGGQQGDQFIGWTMHAELENLVMAGIPPARALVAATKTAAAILGQDDLGTVATGKSADFVVLDANPLDDITNTRRISAVYLRGRAVDRAGLRSAWTH